MGDGTPLYWAAPSTTIASAGRPLSWLPWSQIRHVVYARTSSNPARPAIPTRARSLSTRSPDPDVSPCRPSATVTLLVLQAGPAVARVVAPDPRAARREAWLRAARRGRRAVRGF